MDRTDSAFQRKLDLRMEAHDGGCMVPSSPNEGACLFSLSLQCNTSDGHACKAFPPSGALMLHRYERLQAMFRRVNRRDAGTGGRAGVG